MREAGAAGAYLRALRGPAYDACEVIAMLRTALIACVALGVAACATSPSTPAPKPAVASTAEPPAGCVADTATRLPVRPGDCPAFGRSWTQQDMKSTGATDVGQGLSILDPSVTSTGRP